MNPTRLFGGAAVVLDLPRVQGQRLLEVGCRVQGDRDPQQGRRGYFPGSRRGPGPSAPPLRRHARNRARAPRRRAGRLSFAVGAARRARLSPTTTHRAATSVVRPRVTRFTAIANQQGCHRRCRGGTARSRRRSSESRGAHGASNDPSDSVGRTRRQALLAADASLQARTLVEERPIQAELFHGLNELVELHGLDDVAVRAQPVRLLKVAILFR
jgi:hypothetical protein